MAKRKPLESMLEDLAAARERPDDAATVELLRKALRGRSSHAAAKAAEVAAAIGADEVVDDLVAAFDRFMVKPVQSDPGCAAKEAIAEALQEMGVAVSELYLRGIALRQMEPVWGGRVDTAVGLRGACGIGLARIRHDDAVAVLAVLLADSEAPARRTAAQALAYSGDLSAVPLLRYKCLVGDEDPEVLVESMRALLELAPSESIGFVGSFLEEKREDRAEAAALALGGSRIEAAFEILRDWWERVTDPGLRSSAALAIALLRRESSIDYLIQILVDGTILDARDVLKALAIYRHDERLRQRVEAIVLERRDGVLDKEFAKSFGSMAR